MCLEYPSRYSRAPTAHEAIEGIERMIDEVVADMTAAGATPPSIIDRPQELAHVSLEPLTGCVVNKLADRKTIPSLDDLF